RIGRTGIPLLDAAASPPWEYRNRVRLHRAGENLPAGFKAEGSGRVIAAADCPVAESGVRAALKEGRFPQRECFTVYSRNGLFLCEGGLERGRTRLLDREITLDAGVFFQSNAVMLEKLITDLLETAESAPGGLPAADIYCGVGTFALFLKDRFSRVDLVEENRAALELARENVQGKGIAFFAMKDEDWVKMKNGGRTGGAGDYGFVVADPPRRGLSPGMRRWLAAKGPPLFAYVSCDPATMARDSGELAREYDLEKVYLYDFYPQTAHIESMGVFRRKGGT
ncbi:MAG: methyltransferase, partial [Treponema sp.]|nr:methyltransferase [Treponema sp.]